MSDRKEKQEPECRTWPVWDNYRYAFLWLKQSEGCSVFAVLAADVVLQILVPFLGMALPSAVISFLTSNREPGEILLLVCGYLLLFQILTLIGNYFGKTRSYSLFFFRLDSDRVFFPKCLEVDDQFLESTTGQRKMEMASRNIYSGNEDGAKRFSIIC